MAQSVRMLATKHGDPSSVPGIHMVEEKAYHKSYSFIHTHTQTQT